MEERQGQMSELCSYIARVEKDLTLALQTLQWDRRRLIEKKTVSVSTSANLDEERALRAQGYSETDILLPDAADCYGTVVKLCPTDVSQIIREAAQNNHSFKMGKCTVDAAERPVPQTSDRLLSTFTSDERRAIYDAVVARAPPVLTVEELTLPGDDKKIRTKSRLQVMAEMRDMKRRRTKYKVATKSKNYSQVLREVIKNQMELYTGVKEENEGNHSDRDIPSTSTYPYREIKQERTSVPRDYHQQDFRSNERYKDDQHKPSNSRSRDRQHRRDTVVESSSYDYRKPIKVEKDSRRERSRHDRHHREHEPRERSHRDERDRDHRHRSHESERRLKKYVKEESDEYEDSHSSKRARDKSEIRYKSRHEKRYDNRR